MYDRFGRTQTILFTTNKIRLDGNCRLPNTRTLFSSFVLVIKRSRCWALNYIYTSIERILVKHVIINIKLVYRR